MTTQIAPWSQGYQLAEDFHERLGGEFASGDHVDIEKIIDELHVRVTDFSLSDETIRGVTIAGPQHSPGIGWNSNNPFNQNSSGRHFTLAHELCHLLFDWEQGRGLAIASGPWAPLGIERRANAFAAMLLMPTSIVQAAVSSLNIPLETVEGARNVAHRMGTSFVATLSHLRNLGFIDDSCRNRLLEEFGSHRQ